MKDGEQMAIIKNVKFGMNGSHFVQLWFEVVGEGWGAGQSLSVDHAVDLIKEHNIDDIKYLEGKPCMVDIQNGVVTFLRLIKI